MHRSLIAANQRPVILESLFGFLTGNPAVRQLANEERTKALLHVQIATNKADEIDLILEEIESEIDERYAVSFKVVPVNTPETVAARLDEIGKRISVRLGGAGIPFDEAKLRADLEKPVSVTNDAPVRASLVAHLTSSEALVPVAADRAAQIADAVVTLGPEPGNDVLDAAIASIMDLPAEDALVGDLSWSVGHWSFKVTFEWVTRETKNVNSEVFCVCINAPISTQMQSAHI